MILMWNKLNRAERWVLLAGMAFWMLISILAAPQFASIDVYLFRDAAINFVNTSHFSTASFEHSRSFTTLLYSSYTPLTQWLFIPFAFLFRQAGMAAAIESFVLCTVISMLVLWLLLQRMQAGRLRLLVIALLIATFPMGYMGTDPERPETVTFLLLVLLLFLLRKVGALTKWLLVGLIAGLAFLSEPIGGVFGIFLIAGAIVLPCFKFSWPALRQIMFKSLLAGLAFALPVGLTVLCFLHADSQSLARFVHQSKVAGLARSASGAGNFDSRGDMAPESNAVPAPRGIAKYRDAFSFVTRQGALAMAVEFVSFLFVALWAVALVTSKGSLSARTALFASGFFLFIAVVVFFPLQGNYLMLARGLLPFVFYLNWANCGASLRPKGLIEFMVAINLAILLPASGLSLLQRVQGRQSYLSATSQASFLKSYLKENGLDGGVVLVPEPQYYIYKAQINNIFNPGYLSRFHDTKQVTAVVNCDTVTKFTKPGEKPLPPGVDPGTFYMIAPEGDPLFVTILGRKVMSKNWTWTCDLYARRPLVGVGNPGL